MTQNHMIFYVHSAMIFKASLIGPHIGVWQNELRYSGKGLLFEIENGELDGERFLLEAVGMSIEGFMVVVSPHMGQLVFANLRDSYPLRSMGSNISSVAGFAFHKILKAHYEQRDYQEIQAQNRSEYGKISF